MDEKRPEEMTFEESLDRLNELVELLEGGTLDLNGSIEVYEQAVALRDRCRSILEDGERRIQAIMEKADGTVKDDMVIG